MNNFWHRAKPFVWGTLCVLMALYFSPLNVAIAYAVSTHNVAALWTKLFAPNSVLTLFLGVIIEISVFCFAVGAAIQAYQEREPLTPKFYYSALFCVIYVASFVLYPGFNVFWWQRRAGLQQAATRARPLILAIEKFRLEKKRMPRDLKELVPNYLAKIPQTGMSAYPKFRYATREEKGERAKFQTYEIQVRTPVGFLNADSFNYWPEGDYPAQMYGERTERIGAWAYVHD